ncbi:MAG: hypothetical protein OP8BY_1670 [Candidatus Saccharicenans subterraneus]|uniref:Uncharacterized protein n=1 Tax=Candidatus Saccharicenans subterraneus TaxID=2508984 RepID=A0A3E2BPB5_9BACT|nr:MAG: hypothetical protein OP8BY_1670 [Candidatus Saccharicenans subterraneum]
MIIPLATISQINFFYLARFDRDLVMKYCSWITLWTGRPSGQRKGCPSRKEKGSLTD